MWVVDVVLIPASTILYAQEALLMPISTMCEQLVVIVECDMAEIASGMSRESSSLIIICTSWLWIAFFYMLFELFRAE
jgi:hypothetical protein